MDPAGVSGNGCREENDQLLAQAKRLASALRRERARVGRVGYDPQRHRRILAEFSAAAARLPRRLRIVRRKEFLLK